MRGLFTDVIILGIVVIGILGLPRIGCSGCTTLGPAVVVERLIRLGRRLPELEIDNLSVTTSIVAGRPVTRSITSRSRTPGGRARVLVGPSGCGKSTLLRISRGSPPTGRDHQVAGRSPAPRPSAAWCSRATRLPVAHGRATSSSASSSRACRRQSGAGSLIILEQVGLKGFADAYPSSSRAACSSAWPSPARSPTTRSGADGRAVRRARRPDARADAVADARHLGATTRRSSSSPTTSTKRCSSPT